MKIAQIAPLMGSVPPSHYGGTERVVCYLNMHFHEAPLVAIADHQRHAMPTMNWVDRIHHGLPHHFLSLGPGGRTSFFSGGSPRKNDQTGRSRSPQELGTSCALRQRPILAIDSTGTTRSSR